ncbi:MAG TPA: sigma-70 family RNA polymerase sigma factor [Opitutaceae bacterium]|nr:sigma-70 family RNA polymerase sigma factor [Opitutaceae bacterium]
MDAPDSHHDSWKDWFLRHGPRLLACARQWTRSVADAEDVVQEAFVRFWRRQRSLGGDPTALLLLSIRRSAVDLGRSSRRRAAREIVADGGWTEAEPIFQPQEKNDDRRVALEAALARLSADQREVIVLKIWGERTFEEIGQLLGLSPHTVASRYRYALQALRRELSSVACHE